MAPIYADHPYQLITTPKFVLISKGEECDLFNHIASEMAAVHNIICRWINSIYLQAPHIPPAKQQDFCRYILSWDLLVSLHHRGEEEELFPALEKQSGIPGLMEGNVEQHHLFHAGMESFRDYIVAVEAGREKYDGHRIVSLVEGFAKVLTDHLREEIPTFQTLGQYGPEKFANLQELFDREGQRNMKACGFEGLIGAFSNHDCFYEDKLWYSWPHPPFMIRVITAMMWFFKANIAQFGSVDRQGRLKPLLYAQ